jgi:hypothetical protein
VNALSQAFSPFTHTIFKVAALFCIGYMDEAAELGFEVFETRLNHPKYVGKVLHSLMAHEPSSSHRHNRYSAYFHSLALINRVRAGNLSNAQRDRYMRQVDANQVFLRK